MKPLLAACLIGLLPALAHAQVPATSDADKPQSFEPVLAKDHTGPGRIGVQLEYDKVTGLPHIAALTRGGPAADFGFRVGDIIIRIDRNYTSTLTQDDISLALHGEPGTAVELTIKRDDNPSLIVRALERRILRADQEPMPKPPLSEVADEYVPPVKAPVKP
jgi:C-terminal processing protease CtpA/Prc